MAIFNVGESYRRDYIASQVGGSVQDFLIRSGGQVVGCCYRRELNRQAPATLLVGQGPKKFRAAEIFADQSNFVPFFVRRATHDYEYIGDYRAVRWSKNPQVLEIEKAKGKDPNVGIALYLERFDPTETGDSQIRKPNGKSWRPDPRMRKHVEDAAVQEVIRHFTALGYHIEDRQSENVGWDLEAVVGSERLLLEVKGLSSDSLSVEMTPNEYTHMQKHRTHYRVCVVTNALEASLVLSIFRYAAERERWEDSAGVPLSIDEVLAARLHL